MVFSHCLFPGTEKPAKACKLARHYENKTGLTEMQRLCLHAITKEKGCFLQEVTRVSGRKVYRAYTKNKMMITDKPDFSKVVIRNLVSKGLLIFKNGKYLLK